MAALGRTIKRRRRFSLEEKHTILKAAGEPGRQGDRLQPQLLGRPRPLPRRRAIVHDQQRRRTRASLQRCRAPHWTFAGSDAGGRRAAALYTLIETAKLNDVDPQAWPADVLTRLQDHPAKRLAELLPWNWRTDRAILAA
jgi:hypothetical protein